MKRMEKPAETAPPETGLDAIHARRLKFFDAHVMLHVHVPKTGGTALTRGLSGLVGAVNTIDARLKDQRYFAKNLTEQTRRTLRLYAGHFRYGEHRWFDRKPLYFSAVREPLARFVSYYRMVTSKKGHPAHARYAGMSPEEVFADLETNGRAGADNIHARKLLGPRLARGADFARLKAHVEENYFLVTPTPAIDRAIQRLARAFSAQVIRSAPVNVGSGPKPEISPTLRRRIEDANRIDMELVEWAQANFRANIDRACDYVADQLRNGRGGR